MTTSAAVKFNRYHVTNGTLKARVSYSLDNRVDGRPCVTLYAKDYTSDLAKVMPQGYQNDSDPMTDYFEKGRVNLFETSPFYAAARATAEAAEKARLERWNARRSA